jgi:ligand-binding SRPBCC domain-containing protein
MRQLYEAARRYELMPQIRVETLILAPQELCFDLARDMNVHAQTLAHTGERIVQGPNGLMQLGDTVTFEAKHFGVKQRLTAKITQMDPPHIFTDTMVRGAFQSLVHEHRFEASSEGTLMIDTVAFKAPLGPLGRLAERCSLTAYMRTLLTERGKHLKKIAETGGYNSRSQA